MKELDKKFSKLSVDDMDDLINDLEKITISKKKENELDDLIGSMKSLTIGTKKQKKKMLIKGMKEKKRRVFGRKYKSLAGKKNKELTNKEIDDIFKTMDALKQKGAGGKKYKK